MIDPRYAILFEPVRIGPKTAPNRFYQVPHCTGMGRLHPAALARLREVKAEGGWGVVCTEEVEISPFSEISPSAQGRLWDDADIAPLALMTERVHRHGALAGIELMFNGAATANLYSREIPFAPSHTPVTTDDPIQARAIDKQDIKELRAWHRAAALRARKAGFDIVYVYAGHDLGMPMHFLSRRHNHRTDEYGGCLENRARLLRELIEDAKDAIGDTCAVAVRLAVDDLLGAQGAGSQTESHDVIALLAELPDLWDVNISDWSNDSATARFAEEGFQERHVAFVKKLTSKPVVGVGRFTSPDAMVRQVKSGVLDLIGAARPSIADPFLPRKIQENRIEEIRECIGCNICAASDNTISPIRCTQNPTMGEEWRRGWHPERIAPRGRSNSVLIVGAGPAGLEAAKALCERGYEVTLAEARETMGGRAVLESTLPGLASWRRVADHRLFMLERHPNASLFPASRLQAEDIAAFEADHVAIATGASWRRDGFGRTIKTVIPGLSDALVLTPDDIMAGQRPQGPVLIFDDDHYYLGGVLAEFLTGQGHQVRLVTPAPLVSHWTRHTLEQNAIQTRILEAGVRLDANRRLAAVRPGEADLACVFTARTETVSVTTIVLVTSRLPNDELYHAVRATGRSNVTRIGDCFGPGVIAAAVYAGHRYARELDAPDAGPGFRRERIALDRQ